jgi:hypothetical protein
VATGGGYPNTSPGGGVEGRDGAVAIRSDEGHHLTGRAVDELAAGSAVVAMIRPEKVVAVPWDDDAGAPDRPNAVVVVCEEVTFTGQMSRYVVGTGGGLRFVLRVQNRPGEVPFPLGARLRLTWAVDDLRVFPAGTPTAEAVP